MATAAAVPLAGVVGDGSARSSLFQVAVVFLQCSLSSFCLSRSTPIPSEHAYMLPRRLKADPSFFVLLTSVTISRP
ncbi:hypothetical protein U9M48_003227 [Paspalum notatum var. saurae]|uniref:Uncharacterized protein n=1 Tax=Paspalum notatum var. saurae TaxID=547442 RepID=A0AAQ3PI92_PASNO